MVNLLFKNNWVKHWPSRNLFNAWVNRWRWLIESLIDANDWMIEEAHDRLEGFWSIFPLNHALGRNHGGLSASFQHRDLIETSLPMSFDQKIKVDWGDDWVNDWLNLFIKMIHSLRPTLGPIKYRASLQWIPCLI